MKFRQIVRHHFMLRHAPFASLGLYGCCGVRPAYRERRAFRPAQTAAALFTLLSDSEVCGGTALRSLRAIRPSATSEIAGRGLIVRWFEGLSDWYADCVTGITPVLNAHIVWRISASVSPNGKSGRLRSVQTLEGKTAKKAKA